MPPIEKAMPPEMTAAARELTQKLRAQVASGDVNGAADSLDQLDAALDVGADSTPSSPGDATVSARHGGTPTAPSPGSTMAAAAPATTITPTASPSPPSSPSTPARGPDNPSPPPTHTQPAGTQSVVSKAEQPVATIAAPAPAPTAPAPPAAVPNPLAGLAGPDVLGKTVAFDPLADLFTLPSAPAAALAKSEAPIVVATPPPAPSQPFSVQPFSIYTQRPVDEYVNEKLDPFMKALLTGGRYAADHAIELFKAPSGAYDFRLFDLTLHAAYRRLLNKGGFTEENEQIFRKMEIVARDRPELGWRDFANVFEKGVLSTTAPGYYLQLLVKIMLPVLTPLLNRLPMQKPPRGGKQAEWRVNLGFANLDETQGMTTSEAGVTIGSTVGIGQTINENPLLYQTPYSRHPVNDAVTVEAQYAMLGYDDAFQYSIVRSLTAYMRIAEMATLWNNNQALGPVGAVTVTTTLSGAGISGGTNDKFAVSALTGIGWRQNTLGTGGKGGASTVAGETAATLSAAIDISGGTISAVNIAFPALPGASAYNLYYLPAGVVANSRYVGTFTVDKIVVTTLPGAGAAKAFPTIDGSANSVGYEGVLPWCEISGLYGNATSNKTVTDQKGVALTLAGANRISEFDTILSNLMTNWQLAPSLIIASPNSVRHYNSIVQSGGAAQPYLIALQSGLAQGSLVGGLWAGAYVNNYSLGLQNVPKVIDIMAHPYLADGTFLFLTETIPYPMAREARGWVIEQQIPLTYWPLGALTAHWPYMLFSDQVVEAYHPPANAAIQGVNIT